MDSVRLADGVPVTTGLGLYVEKRGEITLEWYRASNPIAAGSSPVAPANCNEQVREV